MKKLIFISVCAVTLNMQWAFSQPRSYEYACMFYNLENMFHPDNDPGEADDDFTPEGIRRWTYYRYHAKVARVCKVILASNAWNPPAIVTFCELENTQVLLDIVRQPLLLENDYQVLHRDSHDHRGMDVGMIYRPDRLKLLDTIWLNTKNQYGSIMNTREILCATFSSAQDTLLCAVNHWTSKYGGELETEEKRIAQARTLGAYFDSISKLHPNYLLFTLGDFNDGSKEKSIQTLLNDYPLEEILPDKKSFTYKYQGKWESIDHAFVGGRLTAPSCQAIVVQIPFLLEKDEKYTGMMPFRTYRGYAYNGGISDHLPLLLLFSPEKH